MYDRSQSAGNPNGKGKPLIRGKPEVSASVSLTDPLLGPHGYACLCLEKKLNGQVQPESVRAAGNAIFLLSHSHSVLSSRHGFTDRAFPSHFSSGLLRYAGEAGNTSALNLSEREILVLFFIPRKKIERCLWFKVIS